MRNDSGAIAAAPSFLLAKVPVTTLPEETRSARLEESGKLKLENASAEVVMQSERLGRSARRILPQEWLRESILRSATRMQSLLCQPSAAKRRAIEMMESAYARWQLIGKWRGERRGYCLAVRKRKTEQEMLLESRTHERENTPGR